VHAILPGNSARTSWRGHAAERRSSDTGSTDAGPAAEGASAATTAGGSIAGEGLASDPLQSVPAQAGHQVELATPPSLYEAARAEAERYKWIESQKHGRDLGESALREWVRRYWVIYCRFRRLEHLQGCQQWAEFEAHRFGSLYPLITSEDPLLDRILDRVQAGQENLDIILWAREYGLPMERVIGLLEQLDINRARLEPFGFWDGCFNG
jgi:hypothetical protein